MGKITDRVVASSGGGGSGTGFGTLRATVALAAGGNNNLNPHAAAPAWPTNYGRLILTSAGAAAANLTGLLAGSDGQPLVIFNNNPAGGAGAITLNADNAGSLAANRFAYAFDYILSPQAGVLVMYDTTLAVWIIT